MGSAIGELRSCETHILLPNNCPYLLPIDAHVILTYIEDNLFGSIIHTDSTTTQRCLNKHSNNGNDTNRFCPSNVVKCSCDFDQTSVCHDSEGGFVYVITCPICQKPEEVENSHGFCKMFKHVNPPPELCCNSDVVTKSVGKVSVVSEGKIFSFGGYSIEEANNGYDLDLVHCSYDLQEFPIPSHMTTMQDENGAPIIYKSGHSYFTTKVTNVKVWITD